MIITSSLSQSTGGVIKMFKRNQDIRHAKGNIPFWAISEKLSVSENTLLRWLRTEMPNDKKKRVFNAIEAVKQDLQKQEV